MFLSDITIWRGTYISYHSMFSTDDILTWNHYQPRYTLLQRAEVPLSALIFTHLEAYPYFPIFSPYHLKDIS
jgi:hypothetical protein